MSSSLYLIALTITILAAPAPARDWKSEDGQRSFEGELISRDEDHVTIRRHDGQKFSLEISKLHREDRAWLEQQNLAAAVAEAEIASGSELESEPAPDRPAIFDQLTFGDDRDAVLQKLKDSKLVEMLVDEAHLGRFGLNGVFRTKQKIGDLHCSLYFDWSVGGSMRELSLQTDPLGAEAYPDRLAAAWRELMKMMITLHGPPLQNAGYPQRQSLEDGSFLASHLWRLEGGGSALLGSAREGEGYMIVIRFTQETVMPVRVP